MKSEECRVKSAEWRVKREGRKVKSEDGRVKSEEPGDYKPPSEREGDRLRWKEPTRA